MPTILGMLVMFSLWQAAGHGIEGAEETAELAFTRGALIVDTPVGPAFGRGNRFAAEQQLCSLQRHERRRGPEKGS